MSKVIPFDSPCSADSSHVTNTTFTHTKISRYRTFFSNLIPMKTFTPPKHHPPQPHPQTSHNHSSNYCTLLYMAIYSLCLILQLHFIFIKPIRTPFKGPS